MKVLRTEIVDVKVTKARVEVKIRDITVGTITRTMRENRERRLGVSAQDQLEYYLCNSSCLKLDDGKLVFTTNVELGEIETSTYIGKDRLVTYRDWNGFPVYLKTTKREILA